MQFFFFFHSLSVSLVDSLSISPLSCSLYLSSSLNTSQSISRSIDLKDDKILCVAMHPGWVQTDMGGSHAPLTVEESCRQMAETIFALNESHNGGFVQYNGERLEW